MTTRIVLSPEQEEVVALREGAYLVYAPPGAGKTEVIAQRVVRLLNDSRGENYRVLALTFNNRAAASMRQRVRDRLGDESWRATIETYHAFYLDVLRHYGSAIGIPAEVTVYDTVDARIHALAQGLEDDGFVLSGQELDRVSATEMLNEISRMQRALTPPAAAPKRPIAGGFSIRDAYSAYEAVLRRNGAVDFDSLLARAYELLTEQPQVAKHYRRIYRYILVDEAQDTSRVQFELLRALCGNEHRNVFMVADPDQLINRWLGADRENLDRFERDFKARVYRLSTNFRNADAIVRTANHLLAEGALESARTVSASGVAIGWVKARSFRDEQAEARAVIDWILHLCTEGLRSEWLADGESTDVLPEDVAILARSRLQLVSILDELEQRDVRYTYRVGETGPFDTDLYRLSLDALKVLANPRDVAMRRTLLAQLPSQSAEAAELGALGEGEVGRFLASIGQREGDTVSSLLEGLGSAPDIDSAMARLVQPTTEEHKKTDLGERLKADRELLAERWNKYRLLHESRDWSWPGVVMSLVGEPRAEPGGVRVSTVHAAKGLEFRAVALVGLNEGSFPDFRSTSTHDDLASERRLAYVAVTRAARALLISRPGTRTTRFGNLRSQEPSRFLQEMELRIENH